MTTAGLAYFLGNQEGGRLGDGAKVNRGVPAPVAGPSWNGVDDYRAKV
jgi:hypothetical protein